MEQILSISAYIVAITTICGFLYKIYKIISGVEKKVNKFETNLNENTLSTLRLVIINEKMPLSERLKAGAKYTEMRW